MIAFYYHSCGKIIFSNKVFETIVPGSQGIIQEYISIAVINCVPVKIKLSQSTFKGIFNFDKQMLYHYTEIRQMVWIPQLPNEAHFLRLQWPDKVRRSNWILSVNIDAYQSTSGENCCLSMRIFSQYQCLIVTCPC